MQLKNLFLLLPVLLGGCASVYDVTPLVAESRQAAVQASNDGLVVTHKNRIAVVPVKFAINQFESPRFLVTVKNMGDKPFTFSTSNIEVTFNGQPGRVLSYDQQYEDIKNRLSFYNYGFRMPISFQYGYGRPFHLQPVFEDSGDSLDIQIALADLDHLHKYALREKVLNPGDQYSGEVTLGNKLSASDMQHLNMQINLEGEQYDFAFDYNVRH